MRSKKLLAFTLITGLFFSGFTSPLYASAEEMKMTQDNDNLLAQNLLKQVGETYHPNDKVTVLLEVNDDVMNEKYNLEAPEMAKVKTQKGLDAQLDYAEKSQNKLIKAIDDLGVNYKVKERFDTLYNGLAVEMRLNEALEVTSLPEVNSVELNRVIPKPLDKGLEDFYMKDTGSNKMIGSQGAWHSKYTGKGQFIAIIDSGADPNHEIFQKIDMSEARFKNEAQMKAYIKEKGVNPGKFFNNKIPFGYNYADLNTDIKQASKRSHGMHVAGIVAANGKKLKGVAPDAQLAIMRVFSDGGFFGGGTTPAIYNKAIDDAVKLGVDSINMSIGSTGTTDSRVDMVSQNLFKNAKAAGIIISVAAGNDGFMGWGAINNPSVSNPDFGMMNSPAVNDISMAVASVNNIEMHSRSMVVGTGPNVKRFPFAPSKTGELPTTPVNFIYAGHGEPDEVASVDLSGKYALISRGPSEKLKQSADPKMREGLSFAEKINNARAKGAKGVIIFDHLPESPLVDMAGLEEIKIPTCFVSKETGEYLKANQHLTIYFDPTEQVIQNSNGYQLSNFSSWGLSAEGNLKPDISAPGENIYSSINDNSYESMNGTSMAAPHVAGGIAVTKQYVEKTFPEIVGAEKYRLIKNLLMSTAIPYQEKEDKAYASPRGQGAGLMRVDYATSSSVTVEGTNAISSINLGDISGNTVTINGKLHNYSNKEKSYCYYAVLNTDSVKEGKILLKPRELKSSKEDKKTIKVAPKSTAEFSLSFTLEAQLIKALADLMPKGYFLEGYVFFESSDGTPTLSIPYVGFKGNWENLTVIEESIYDLVAKNERPYYYERIETLVSPFTHLSSKNEGAPIVLGQTPKSTFEKPDYKKETIAISPNGDGKADDAKFVATFLRNYKDFELAIYEKNDTARKNPIYKSNDSDNFGLKNFFMMGLFGGPNTTTTKSLWGWDGKLSTGEIAPEGDYFFEIKAKADGLNGNTQIMDIPVKLDLTFPRIIQSSLKDRVYEIQEIDEKGSGLRQVYLKHKDGEILPIEEMRFIIPDEVKLSDVFVEVVDNAFNTVEIPLEKAVRNGNERMIVVTPKISVGSVASHQFHWEVKTLTGESVDPFNLKVGSYELEINDVDDKLELIGPTKIPFTVGENDFNKVIEVPFRYQNRIEVIIPVSNSKNANFLLLLLDKSTGAEYEIRKGNHTSAYIGYVPPGEYKILIKDLQEGFLARMPQGDTIKVNQNGTGAPTIGVEILPKREKETTISLVRGEYNGTAEVVLLGTDVAKTTYIVNFEPGETEKTLAVAYPMIYDVFARNLEGDYGSTRAFKEVSGRNPFIAVELVKNGKKQDIPIDKEPLELKLNYIDTLNESDYISGWDELLIAKDEALEVLKNENATQEDVTNAVNTLDEAIKALQAVGSDGITKVDLEACIKEAEMLYNSLKPDEYTKESIEFLAIAIEAGKVTLKLDDPEKHTSEHLAAQIDLINRAIKNLTRKDGQVDKGSLMVVVKRAEEILENSAQYTPETIANLEDFLENAKVVLESETTTRKEVDIAEEDLQKAIDDLIANTDKTELTLILTQADEILKRFGDYALEGKKEFRLAYRTAKNALEKGSLLQIDIDKATQALKEAIAALKKKEVPKNPQIPKPPITPDIPNPEPIPDTSDTTHRDNEVHGGGSVSGAISSPTVSISSIAPENQSKDTHKPIMSGYPNGEFRPNEKLTRAEVAMIFAQIGKLKKGKASFTDVVEGKWYTDAIGALVENHIVSGYQDGTFRPDKVVTRAEFISMLVRLKGEKLTGSHEIFKDSLEASWAIESIAHAHAKHWISGYQGGYFKPNQSISRAEGAVILAKAFNLCSEGSTSVFLDVDHSHWAYQAIRALTN